MTELIPAQAEAVAALRPLLPPILADHERGLDYLAVAACVGPDDPTGLVAIDLEWDDAGVITLIGVGNERRVVQLVWPVDNAFRQVEIRDAIERLVQSVPVVYQNAIADIKVMRRHGFNVHPTTHRDLNDVMLADAVLESEEAHDLEDINRRHGRLPDWKLLRDVAPDVYNAADLVSPVLLWRDWFAPQFKKDPAAEDIYRMSLDFLKEIQVETEEAGIRVDKSKPYVLYDRYDLKRKQAAQLAQAYCGWPLNLRSPDDMKHVLYDVEGLPKQYEKGPPQAGRKLTVDKDAIAALRRWHGTEFDPDEPPTLEEAWSNIDAGGHPLLEARYLMMGAQQAISHYIEPCLEVGPKGELLGVKDRIRPEIRQHVQASGRHSFVGPAVQQMKGDVLDQLTPDPGTVWVSWDWSQIEIRLLAVLANDQPYLDAFARGDDIHELNVRMLFGPKGSEELEALRRRFTKAFAFRLHYRGKPENAADIPGTRLLGMNADRLVAASDVYMAGHPAIPEYWERLERQIETYRAVRTFMGRPRRLTSPYKAARIREGCNHPCQGGVSDVYVTVALGVKRAAPYARFVYGAHDAQTWQVPRERADEFRALIEPVVHQEFDVHGRATVFPADFKPYKEAA